jgi:hypothetical protein
MPSDYIFMHSLTASLIFLRSSYAEIITSFLTPENGSTLVSTPNEFMAL